MFCKKKLSSFFSKKLRRHLRRHKKLAVAWSISGTSKIVVGKGKSFCFIRFSLLKFPIAFGKQHQSVFPNVTFWSSRKVSWAATVQFCLYECVKYIYFLHFFQKSIIKRRQLNFLLYGPTNPNFRQIKQCWSHMKTVFYNLFSSIFFF